MPPRKSSTAKPQRPASEIALQAEERLHKSLVRIGSDEVHYLRCFRTANSRQMALSRTNQGIYLWSEPVWEHAASHHQAMRKKRYAPEAVRIHTLEANAPRLYKGHAADYWQFPTLGDLDAFIDWYKTL